jgi:Cu(I)/Ag(I) efflux system membrane fusion protein
MYVNTGTKIYTIADLSQVWVRLDAYESDLIWLRYGHNVEFTAESYPGEIFKGTISFIDPILNEATRTVKVRVNVPNPEMKLKPGMFVRAEVRARIASSGRVMDKSLAGKWICPMHPEEVKEGAGKCGICEMPRINRSSYRHRHL